MAISFAKTDEAKKLIQTVERVQSASVRPYVVTPGTPKDRVQIPRKAFMETVRDPAFLAEAQKANLDINPDGGAELEQNVRDIFKLEPSLIAKLKEILKYPAPKRSRALRPCAIGREACSFVRRISMSNYYFVSMVQARAGSLFCLIKYLVEPGHRSVIVLDHSFGPRRVKIQTLCQVRRISRNIGPRGNSSKTS